MSTQDVASARRLMVGGDQEVTRFRDPTVGEDYDVELRLVIGGQSLSLFLTLVVIPVAYSLFDDLAVAVRSKRTLGPAVEPLQT